MAFHITISLTDISDKDFTKTMKMAIALACIRNKPEDKTAGEYTEQLCQNYLKKQLAAIGVKFCSALFLILNSLFVIIFLLF
jgi:hypothetical protein